MHFELPWLYFRVGTTPTSRLFEADVFVSGEATGLRGGLWCWGWLAAGGEALFMVRLDTWWFSSWTWFWTWTTGCWWTFWMVGTDCWTGGETSGGRATLVGIIWWVGTFGQGLWWSLKDDLADVDLKY